MKKNTDIKLKVVEALQDDAYKGVARIDPQIMRNLGLNRGDAIMIKGARETVALVDRAYPADVGENIIRIDGLIRRNAKTSVGETVSIYKAALRPAAKVSIAPAQAGIVVHMDTDIFKNALLGRPVTKGDIISLGGVRQRRDNVMPDGMPDFFGDMSDLFGGAGFGAFAGFQNLKFHIFGVSPNAPCIITEQTEINLSQKAVDINEESVPDVTYEDIGGLTDEVKKIREMVELPLKHPEVFDKLGIEPPKGVLLHGPPGTGKTLLAKAVANESEAHFILLNGPEIMSKFYGESEKKVRDIFDEAEKNAPSIIFIDEIDAIAPKREDVQGEVERRVVSQLLTMLDGLKTRGRIIVIGATNRINSLDPALRRPGRFDREVEISVPDKQGRLNILKIHTRNMPLDHWESQVVATNLLRRMDSFESESNKRIKELRNREEKASEDISQLNKEIDSASKQLKELEKQKEDSPSTMAERILYKIGLKKDEIKELKNKIIENEDKIARLKSEVKGLQSNIIKVNRRSEEVTEKTDLLNKIVSHLGSLKHEMDLRNENDPRKVFMKEEIKKVDSQVLEIVEDFKDVKLISNEFFDEAVKDSIAHMLEVFAGKTHGFVGADLNALTKEAAMNVLRKLLPEMKMEEEAPISQEILDKIIIKADDFDEALKVVRPSAMREVLVETPNISWEDIGGLENTKQSLREAVEWPIRRPEGFKRLGIRPPRGILLYGPPGTGKTLLAKAVAKESEANFIHVKGPSLLSMWVGKSEEGVRKVFERARQVSPCVIFFDEIDALATRRGADHGSNVTDRVLNQLLAEVDGLEGLKDVTIMGATNRPDMLDPALLRPGRFDRVILVDIPDAESRKKIFEVHTKGMPLAKDVNIASMVSATEGFVGADIEGLVREAAMNSLRRDADAKEVTKKDFDESLAKIRPSVSPETAKRYKKLEEYYLKSAKAGLELGPVYAG